MALVIGGEQAPELGEQTTVVLRLGPSSIESTPNLEVDEGATPDQKPWSTRAALFNQPEEFYSAQQTPPDVSLEELRLEDYQLHPDGGMKAENETLAQCFAVSSIQPQKPPNEIRQETLNLLRGPGIEIIVGTPCDLSDAATTMSLETWTLPKRLISYYSPFFEAACERDFKERQENKIHLPDDEPAVFAGFVEWLYYGINVYKDLFTATVDPSDGVSMDAKRWVLGDKLLCTNFKNEAMYQLYIRHVTSARLGRPVTPQDVRYVCENSASNSELTQFYLDVVTSYFSDTVRVSGSFAEWDNLLVDHRDFRLAILGKVRFATGVCIKAVSCYYDQGNADKLLENEA